MNKHFRCDVFYRAIINWFFTSWIIIGKYLLFIEILSQKGNVERCLERFLNLLNSDSLDFYDLIVHLIYEQSTLDLLGIDRIVKKKVIQKSNCARLRRFAANEHTVLQYLTCLFFNRRYFSDTNRRNEMSSIL